MAIPNNFNLFCFIFCRHFIFFFLFVDISFCSICLFSWTFSPFQKDTNSTLRLCGYRDKQCNPRQKSNNKKLKLGPTSILGFVKWSHHRMSKTKNWGLAKSKKKKLGKSIHVVRWWRGLLVAKNTLSQHTLHVTSFYHLRRDEKLETYDSDIQIHIYIHPVGC